VAATVIKSKECLEGFIRLEDVVNPGELNDIIGGYSRLVGLAETAGGSAGPMSG